CIRGMRFGCLVGWVEPPQRRNPSNDIAPSLLLGRAPDITSPRLHRPPPLTPPHHASRGGRGTRRAERNNMRTEEPRPVRLEDYRPPDWLGKTRRRDVAPNPTATRVRARLALEPNPKATPGAPLVLDGDGLTLKNLALDGAPLAADHYTATPDQLTVPAPARPLTLDVETIVDPSANTQLMGLY